jgi:hypothetical protein
MQPCEKTVPRQRASGPHKSAPTGDQQARLMALWLKMAEAGGTLGLSER